MHRLPPVLRIRSDRSAIFFLIILLIAGLGGNYFKFSILNLDFIFGSVFALLVLQFFGAGLGVISAAIISSYTYFSWNHPYAMIIMTVEVLAVAWLSRCRKVNLVLADSLYWLIIGIPLGLIFFHGLGKLSLSDTLLIVTKETVNGIFNAVLARMIFSAYSLYSGSSVLPLREIMLNLMAFFTLSSTLTMLIVDSHNDFNATDERIKDTLARDSQRVAEGLENWVENRKNAMVTLAQLATTLSADQMQPHLDQTLASDKNIYRLALMDADATAIASSPKSDEMGQQIIGMNFSNRPYLPLLKQRREPLLSQVMLSKFGRHEPLVIMLAPVRLNGTFGGYVGGRLKFDRIETILKISADNGLGRLYTLLDQKGRVIVSNHIDQPIMTSFTRAGGEFRRHSDRIQQWIPPLATNRSTIELWGDSHYLAESTIGSLAEWRLILEQPVAAFQQMLYDRYTRKLTRLFLILLIALAAAEWVTRRMTHSNERLGRLTRDLPDKLESGAVIAWPVSGIQDNRQLIENFRRMAASLKDRFKEIDRIHASLEAQITARTQALRVSEKRLNATQTLAKVGGWEWDIAQQRMHWTDTSYHIHDLDPKKIAPGSSEHITKSLECYDAKDRPVIQKAFEQCAAFGKSYDLEFPFTSIKGRRLWIRTLGQAEWEGDRVIKVIGTIMDITAHKHAKQEKKKLQDQLVQAQKMEAVGRLAGGVAHDFNNMLSIIIGNAELVLEAVDPSDPLNETIQEIIDAGLRSANLTRQLLAFARRQTIAPERVDLNAAITEMLKMLKRLIGEDIELLWKPFEDLWPVKMDPSQIDQILANLTVNARDAIFGVGSITIETANVILTNADCIRLMAAVPGKFVRLAVSDTGSGMDKETLDNLFEPFFTTKKTGQGTGLGLAMVYGIVRQNNGAIAVASEPEKGTTINIYFPCYTTPSQRAETAQPDRPPVRGDETILLVEDELSMLKLTRVMLERLGYTVVVAQSPNQAIETAEQHPEKIHLLITDVVMPEMNGRDLAEKLRSLFPELKRLFMSGYTADIIARHGILDQGTQFIQKPFSKADLAVKVREALAS